MPDATKLQANGRVSLKCPQKFGQRIFWFSSISDSEITPELSDPYFIPDTGQRVEAVASFSREPATVVAPYDDVKLYPLYKMLEDAVKASSTDELVWELSEKVGDKVEIYEGVSYRKHMRTGTDLSANSARTLTIEFYYVSKSV